MNNKDFKKHFRIYFKNGHPAYIIDEEGNLYLFHRVTHSKTSGNRKNWVTENPLISKDDSPMYIVKRTEKDNKGRFSLFQLEVKPGFDPNNLEIKNAGGSQAVNNNVEAMNNITTSKGTKRLNRKGNQAINHRNGHVPPKCIKSNKKRRRNRKCKKVKIGTTSAL